jgi:hypothetical protein
MARPPFWTQGELHSFTCLKCIYLVRLRYKTTFFLDDANAEKAKRTVIDLIKAELPSDVAEPAKVYRSASTSSEVSEPGPPPPATSWPTSPSGSGWRSRSSRRR